MSARGGRRKLTWMALALAGIAFAAAVSLAASALVGQHIGLTSQPLGAGQNLAVVPVAQPHPRTGKSRPSPRRTSRRRPTSPAAATPSPAQPLATATASAPPPITTAPSPVTTAPPPIAVAPQPVTTTPTPRPSSGGGSGVDDNARRARGQARADD